MSCAHCPTPASGSAKHCPALFCASRNSFNAGDADQAERHVPRGPHQAPRLWVLTADKHHIRIFEKHGQKLVQVAELSENGKIVLTAEAIDLIGLVETDMTDHHDVQLKKLSAWLDETLRNDAFDRLILIAPPHLLGEIRKTLSHTVQMRIIAEINKDLTHFNGNDLKKELQKIMWF